MKIFVIQSKIQNGYEIPAQSFGYTAIDQVEFWNWFHPEEKQYDFVLNDHFDFKGYLKRNFIPIGSVEYVVRWMELMGAKNVKPLNIPKELWKFCDRQIKIASLDQLKGHWMVKSTEVIKCPENREINWSVGKNAGPEKFFLSEWVDNVESEWRVFVLNKKIIGIRCYSGDEWIIPDKNYVESIVKTYDRKSYTLDLLVSDKGKRTEILELHDFFSCGLYGFENPMLPVMWSVAINEMFE